MTQPKHVHFIGICGVAMSAVATALWQKGYKVTGSDSGFFPPVSTHLTKLGIAYYPGWHPERMCHPADNRGLDADSRRKKECPDFVVIGNAVSTQNPEFLFVQEKKIPYMSYPEAIEKFLIRPHSIVCAGTYGKTTSSALLTHILRHANQKPSYMIGGITQDGFPSAEISDGEWSVVEGDEYTTSKWDQRPKFAHYKSTHLLLTAVKWDHADIYPTEKSYLDVFEKLIDSIPKKGLIVYCSDESQLSETFNFKLLTLKTPIVSYGENKNATYRYENVTQSPEGIVFDIVYHGKIYNIKCPLLGSYNAENTTGCFALAKEIGIAPGDITDAISTFHGMKRRIEKRYENEVTVIDDIAHSPEKAKSVLSNLRAIYSGLITAVYEPNIGNRTFKSKPGYKDAFKDADTVIIPHLSKLKVDKENKDKTFDGDGLAKTISNEHKDVQYIDDDKKLVEFITTGRNKGDCIVFLGSHGFRGMIEETIKKLAQR